MIHKINFAQEEEEEEEARKRKVLGGEKGEKKLGGNASPKNDAE